MKMDTYVRQDVKEKQPLVSAVAQGQLTGFFATLFGKTNQNIFSTRETHSGFPHVCPAAVSKKNINQTPSPTIQISQKPIDGGD